jgi:LysM repeat protein
MAEALKTQSEANKNAIEALMMSAKTPDEIAKAQAEAQKLLAEADKIRSETKALLSSEPETAADGEEVVPPPSSTVPIDSLREVAKKHQVDEAVVALAVNAGYPVLARASQDGMQVSLLPADSQRTT